MLCAERAEALLRTQALEHEVPALRAEVSERERRRPSSTPSAKAPSLSKRQRGALRDGVSIADTDVQRTLSGKSRLKSSNTPESTHMCM